MSDTSNDASPAVDGSAQPPAPPPVLCYLDTDAAGVVLSATRSNAPQQRADGSPQADAAAAPDGTVFVGSSKVTRAAGDFGSTGDAWFKRAGA